jgi:hypothetical protein
MTTILVTTANGDPRPMVVDEHREMFEPADDVSRGSTRKAG